MTVIPLVVLEEGVNYLYKAASKKKGGSYEYASMTKEKPSAGIIVCILQDILPLVLFCTEGTLRDVRSALLSHCFWFC